MAAGLALPLISAHLALLFACAALVGLGHVFFHVSMHSLVGALGEGAQRTRNFATFSLGISIAAFIGPSLAGFAIELAGFGPAFAVLAVVAALPALYLLIAASRRRLSPEYQKRRRRAPSISSRSRRCDAPSS